MRTPRQQRGVVLVAVLLALAIMAVMVAALTSLTRAGIASEGLEQRRLASHFALRSGLEAAKALIAAMPPEERLFLDATPKPLDLGNGLAAEALIRDAQGLADLNRSDPKLLEALLAGSLGAARAQKLAATIADLRARATPKTGESAPKPGETPTPPVIFHATAQLQALAGPSAPPLADWFTVFNPTGSLNPLAAPQDLLAAIPTLTPADRSAIAKARKTRSPQQLTPITERLKPTLALTPPTTFTITIRLTTGETIIPNTQTTTTIHIPNTDQTTTIQTLNADGG